MEPNKLETQIREQLNAREIQPSPTAWDRLDAMLAVVEEKKTKRFAFLSYRNIGIAASILLLVSLGLFNFSPKEIASKPENTVVKGNENVNANNNFNQTVNIKREEQLVETTNHKPQTINHKPQTINNNPPTIIQNNEVIAQNQLPKVVEPSQEIRVSNSIKVNAVDLLAAVDNPIKSNTSPKIKVNANSLLSQVDGELDQTFREKALNQISKNYKEIKVAVLTRNQE